MSKEFKHESLEITETIVQYLNSIRDGFENGQLVLGNKFEQFELEPSNNITMKIKVKRKDGSVKVSIKFQWEEKLRSKKNKMEFSLLTTAM